MRSRILKQQINLNIAGLIIALKFDRTTEAADIEERYIGEIERYFQYFIYIGDKVPNFYIEFSHQSKFEVLLKNNSTYYFINFYKQVSKFRIATFYHIGIIQLQMIIRKVCQVLITSGKGFIMHASAAKKGDEVSLFLGDSGAGKSTITKLIYPIFMPKGDDSVIIKKEERSFFYYSTPALEKDAWFIKDNKRWQIGGVYFIRKSDNNKLTPITDKEEVFHLLIRQLFTEKGDLETQAKTLFNFIKAFNGFYFLDFSLRNKDDLVELIS